MGWNPWRYLTCRIAWKGWKVMKDWNVWNVSGRSGMTGVSGKTGKTGMSEMSGKTGMSGMPLEGLAAGVPGMSCRTHGWISRRSPCLLCIEFLFWNEGLFALCM